MLPTQVLLLTHALATNPLIGLATSFEARPAQCTHAREKLGAPGPRSTPLAGCTLAAWALAASPPTAPQPAAAAAGCAGQGT